MFAGATFAFLSPSGLEAFDRAYAEGVIDHVFATNLTYTPKRGARTPVVQPGGHESKHMAFVIATLNPRSVPERYLHPWNHIEALTKYRAVILWD